MAFYDICGYAINMSHTQYVTPVKRDVEGDYYFTVHFNNGNTLPTSVQIYFTNEKEANEKHDRFVQTLCRQN